MFEIHPSNELKGVGWMDRFMCCPLENLKSAIETKKNKPGAPRGGVVHLEPLDGQLSRPMQQLVRIAVNQVPPVHVEAVSWGCTFFIILVGALGLLLLGIRLLSP